MINGYKKVFWGMILTVFHFNLGSIEILPNFIGILIVSSGIREVLDGYDNSNLRIALEINKIKTFMSFVIFILPFIGIETSFNNILFSTIWFNINTVLEIMSVVKLLEGTSEILSENFNTYLGNKYYNNAISYIYLYSIVVIVCNINFIFMSGLISFLIALYALVIILWIAFSFRKLYKDDLQIYK